MYTASSTAINLGGLWVGLLVTTYTAVLGAVAYQIRRSGQERRQEQRAIRRKLNRQQDQLRKIDTRGTFGSRGRTVDIERSIRDLAVNVPQLTNLVTKLSVEVEAQQVDISELAARVTRIEERQLGAGR